MMWAHTPIALNSGVFSKHFRKSRAILNDNSFGSRNYHMLRTIVRTLLLDLLRSFVFGSAIATSIR